MTGAPIDLLAECEAHGIRLELAGDDGLTIDAPKGTLTPELKDRLKTHKAELLAVLRPSPQADVPSAPESKIEPEQELEPDWRPRPSATYLNASPVLAKPCELMKPICRCGSSDYRDVVLEHPPHNGTSVRRDCARCDRFIDHIIWYGKVTGQ